MSYDIHCYRSERGEPDLEEAQNSMESDESDAEGQSTSQLDLLKALTDFNPRLEVFNINHDEIAKLHNISKDEAEAKNTHIELSPPEGDLAIQITINPNSVSLTIPYWYAGEQARQVFKTLMDYLKIIRRTSGYFVYDPQTDQVFDPLKKDIKGLDIYLQTTYGSDKGEKKPWWKFW